MMDSWEINQRKEYLKFLFSMEYGVDVTIDTEHLLTYFLPKTTLLTLSN